jgi:hypothetical protein
MDVIKLYKLIFAVIFFIFSFNCLAQDHHAESYYQDKIAKSLPDNPVREYILDDGTRVDILTDKRSIEVEFAHKFYESIGQSLHYSLKTGKIPCIYLIRESEKDDKYIERCKNLCKKVYIDIDGKLIKIEVWVYDGK